MCSKTSYEHPYGKLYIQPYSKQFTGIIESKEAKNPVNYHNRYNTVPISPGSKDLIIRYRFQFDEKWNDLPEKFELVVSDFPFEMPSATNTMYGLNSHGIDCDGHTMPPAEYSHYTCDYDQLRWRTDYS